MDPILIKHVREPNSFTLDFYLRHEGYDALKKALTHTPDQIIDMVKTSGLRGAGAYEAGEETALLESLEGKRAQPRNKPPFPALVGLYGKPTAVNNVETLCNVPLIVAKGAEWFAALGPEKNGGPKLYCVSGQVKRPGVYETTMKITLRELIEGFAGGVRDGRTLKAVIPGGSSVPILLPSQLDTQASFDAIQKAGSLLGSAAIIVLNDTTCMVWLAENLFHFYRH